MNIQKQNVQNQYISGSCNIGQEETKRRLGHGWLGLVVAFILFLLFVLFGVPAIWRLTIFFPVAISASGFLQAKNRFCAYFGLKGTYNFDSVGAGNSVERAEDRAHDRKKAWQIILISILIGFLAALIAYFL